VEKILTIWQQVREGESITALTDQSGASKDSKQLNGESGSHSRFHKLNPKASRPMGNVLRKMGFVEYIPVFHINDTPSFAA
jgi:hypothetical protein